MPSFEPVKWPNFLPPFLDDASRFSPEGYIWVQRTTPPTGPAMLDIIDSMGRLVRQVLALPDTRLVGFGRAHLYMARADSDGQEFLQRYRASSGGAP
jgi:hypothetical protein